MPQFTAWKSDKSDGSLPLDEGAGLFQYRHFIHWETYQTWAAGIGRNGTGSWHIQIKDPSGIVIFEQTVQITVTVLFFGFVMVWYYYSRTDEINTTIIAGNAVTKPIPPMYLLGSEDGYMTPGGDSVSGNIIDAFWQSPVYKMDIPAGSKLIVINDRWGLGASARPDWQWRFGEGTTFQIDSTFDSFGFLNSVSSFEGAKDLIAQRSLPNHNVREQLTIMAGKSPTMSVLRNGKVLLLKDDNGTLTMYESDDAMMSFNVSDNQLSIGGLTMPHLVALRNGGFLVLAKGSGAFRYIRMGSDGKRTDGVINSSASYKELSAAQSDNGVITLINETGAPVANSSDDGVSFNS